MMMICGCQVIAGTKQHNQTGDTTVMVLSVEVERELRIGVRVAILGVLIFGESEKNLKYIKTTLCF